MPWEVDGKYREIGRYAIYLPQSNKQDLFAEFTMPLWQPARILNRQGSRCARVGDAVGVGKTYVGDVKGESDTREFYRVPAGFSARRDRLVQDLVRKCRDGGMAVVSAPAGFGKTALLLQYADSIKEDMTRGDVVLSMRRECVPLSLGSVCDVYSAISRQPLRPL